MFKISVILLAVSLGGNFLLYKELESSNIKLAIIERSVEACSKRLVLLHDKKERDNEVDNITASDLADYVSRWMRKGATANK